MSGIPELEGTSASAGAMEATHLSKKSAKLKYQVAVIGIPHGKATSPVNIAHSPYISANGQN